MRRPRLLVLAAVALLLLCAAPLVMGFVIERVYSELIAAANQRAEGRFLVVGEFEQGLWTSSATTGVTLRGDADREPIVFRHVFVHGPVPLGELLRGRWPWSWVFTVLETRYRPGPAGSPELREGLAERSLVECLVWIHFDRSARLSLVIPELELKGAGFSFGGLWGEGEATRSGRFSGRMTLGRTVLAQDAALVLDGASLSLVRTPLDDGLEDLEMTLEVGQFELTGQRFGPGEIIGAIRRVDLRSALELNATLSALDDSDLPEAEANLARAEALAGGLPRLLRGSPELEISKLSLASGSQALNGRARISVDGSDPARLANRVFLMGVIQADAEMAVPEGVLENALDRYIVGTMAGTEGAEGLSEADLHEMASFLRGAVLGTLLAQKRIVREEGEFRLDMRLDAGLLFLNGERVDPAELSNPMSPM